MASVGNDANGRKRILFLDPRDGKRKTLRLGKCDRRTAQVIAVHLEALLAARVRGLPLPPDTAAFVREVQGELREKLIRLDLLDAPRCILLGEFLRDYILSRPDVKPATLTVWQQPRRNLLEFFGEGKPLRDITAGEAEQFKAWLSTQGLAPTTLAKRLTFARTFFHAARKHRFIEANPFAEVKIPSASVRERQHFIDRPTVQRLLEHASPTWRIIIALCRYGGLRCPSEVLSLKWECVDWGAERITVISPKTDRYAGKERREIPLFAELRPYLEEAWELAQPGQEYVVPGDHLAKAQGPTGWRNCNLRTAFAKLIRRAGLQPWPRLFHNLRSSRETELLEQFPVHVVAQWLGHDPKISLKHYAQITAVHYRLAAQGGTKSGTQVAQQTVARNCTGSRWPPQLFGIEELMRSSAMSNNRTYEQKVTLRGFEPRFWP